MAAELIRARDLIEATSRQNNDNFWRLEALSGRITELSGIGASAALTMISRLIHEAHAQEEPAAWISAVDSVFFPPDMAQAGVDLSALPVIWTESPHRAAFAAETLLRSGSFALVVIDLGSIRSMKEGVLGRMLRLAQKHNSAVICITQKQPEEPSLGSMISLRILALRERLTYSTYRCSLRVLKDKQAGSLEYYREERHAPSGVR